MRVVFVPVEVAVAAVGLHGEVGGGDITAWWEDAHPQLMLSAGLDPNGTPAVVIRGSVFAGFPEFWLQPLGCTRWTGRLTKVIGPPRTDYAHQPKRH